MAEGCKGCGSRGNIGCLPSWNINEVYCLLSGRMWPKKKDGSRDGRSKPKISRRNL